MTSIEQDLSLVVGADGGLGGHLVRRLTSAAAAVVGTTRRPDNRAWFLDLAAEPTSWMFPEDVSVAYLCAAVTSLEKCRQHPQETRLVNVERTLALAARLRDRGAHIVFLSTNLVFDGSRPRRQTEETVRPLTEYGRQKAAVERELLDCGAAIVRLTKVFAQPPKLFPMWADSLLAGTAIAPFQDMVLAPVPAEDVIIAMLTIGGRRGSGIYQISGDRDISYAEAASVLARHLGVDSGLVRPRSAIEQGLPAEEVPAHTTLDTSRLKRELGIELPTSLETIQRLVETFVGRRPGALSSRNPPGGDCDVRPAAVGNSTQL